MKRRKPRILRVGFLPLRRLRGCATREVKEKRMRSADRIAAWLVSILGVAHLAVGHAVFIEPTERRIWFASAGFLLIVTGLANLGAQGGESRIQSLAAAVGSVSIVVLGALLARADPNLLLQPQTLTLLALGVLLTVCRLRDLIPRKTR